MCPTAMMQSPAPHKLTVEQRALGVECVSVRQGICLEQPLWSICSTAPRRISPSLALHTSVQLEVQGSESRVVLYTCFENCRVQYSWVLMKGTQIKLREMVIY